jgi:biotin transport system substrate-specific component
MKFTLRELILSSMFAALTAVCAQISFLTPFSLVPITLQTFAVFLSAIILGRKYGTISQVVYILIGLCGAPVFAVGTHPGLSALTGVTGGYLISFPIVAFITGTLITHKKNLSRMDFIGIMIIGMLVCYLFGSVQFILISKMDYVKAIMLYVIPFVPFDILKIIAASFLGYQVRNALIKANLLRLD